MSEDRVIDHVPLGWKRRTDRHEWLNIAHAVGGNLAERICAQLDARPDAALVTVYFTYAERDAIRVAHDAAELRRP